MIKQYIDLRHETDRYIPIWLPILGIALGIIPLLLITYQALTGFRFIPFLGLEIPPVEIIFILILLLFTSPIILYLLAAIIVIYLVYVWLDRINKHLNRIRMMYKNIALYLEKKGYHDLSKWINNEISELEYRMSMERNPVLWGIAVVIINILIWYILYMVNDSLRKIGSSEHSILKRIDSLFREKGLESLEPYIEDVRKVEERNVILYITLSVITLGLFTLYWAYLVTKDINKHFKVHHIPDDKLLTLIETL